MDEPNEAVSSGHSRTDAHMNSQRLGQHAQGVQRFKPDEVPALRGGSGHEFPLLTKKLSVIDTYCQR